MKRTLLLFLITSFSVCSRAQSGEWTWMKGDTINGSSGIFGTLGVGDSLNAPPAVYEPCEWTDHSGKFWLLGGGYYNNCLWMYDPTTNEWTWMGGSNLSSQTGA